MESSSFTDDLPDFLRSSWKIDPLAISKAEADGTLAAWTVSSLTGKFVDYHVAKHKQMLVDREAFHSTAGDDPTWRSGCISSLQASAVAEILSQLERSENVAADLRTIVSGLNRSSLRRVLLDPRTPYLVVRKLLMRPNRREVGSKATDLTIDIDMAVIRNEDYIRSRGPLRNKDGRGLIRLDDLVAFHRHEDQQHGNEHLMLNREVRSDTTFDFFDFRVPLQIEVQPSSSLFTTSFHRITGDILKGLDWNNILIAGGVVLTTLLHLNPADFHFKCVREEAIDVYIYGLGPVAANEKMKDLYRVWSENLPLEMSEPLVVKDATRISFFCTYPNRRIQIILKLMSSPTDVLLSLDLDPCAVGFDGEHVFMLPRCARALETGYSTFTMDLIWGAHLDKRQPADYLRMLKYAKRGFGVRILHSYIRHLEAGDAGKNIISPAHCHTFAERNHDHLQNYQSHAKQDWEACSRRPNGKEAGMKTLKRVEYQGRNYIWMQPVSSLWSHERSGNLKELLLQGEGGKDQYTSMKEFSVSGESDHVEGHQRPKHELILGQKNRRHDPPYPLARHDLCGSKLMDATTAEILQDSICPLGSFDLKPALPHGVNSFEILMRRCEAANLLTIVEGHLSAEQQDPFDQVGPTASEEVGLVGSLPQLYWSEYFHADALADDIDELNEDLFVRMQGEISERLGLPLQRTGYKDYLTRRIRQTVHGENVEAVLEKQMTIPVIVGHDLEEYLKRLMREALQDGCDVPADTQEQLLIPVHEVGHGNQVLPDLPEDLSPKGNLRYWVIGNETMWAGIDRKIDMVFDVLKTITGWIESRGTGAYIDTPSSLHHFAHEYRKMLPYSLEGPANKDKGQLGSSGDLDPASASLINDTSQRCPMSADNGGRKDTTVCREAHLFRQWVLHWPLARDQSAIDQCYYASPSPYPPPDEAFWSPVEKTASTTRVTGSELRGKKRKLGERGDR
ncbi:MAG: hypothetical protein M1833_003391 [Piccolia ochrophora]|nr:MAG: hypothetical protein M1833_003391 [Piccolia ochrophora]